MKKIGFLGVHSGGKTSMVHLISGILKEAHYNAIPVEETARKAIKAGFDLNKESTMNSQLWMMGRQIEDEISATQDNPDFIFTDRTIFDPIVYATATGLGLRDVTILSVVAGAFFDARPYDLMIYFAPLKTGIEKDGVRDLSQEYQNKINETFLGFTKEVLSKIVPVVYLTRTTKRGRRFEILQILEDKYAVKQSEEE